MSWCQTGVVEPPTGGTIQDHCAGHSRPARFSRISWIMNCREAVWWSTSVTRAFWKLEITAALSSRKARSRQSVASVEVSRPSASAIASARS